MKQLEIGGSKSAADWASFCREVVYDSMIAKKQKIGGERKTVQIDESKFGKRKYQRGHKVEGQWVFGGIEEESGNVFMVPVDKRDSATLIPIIKDWILPGTTIVSDYWKPYDCLEHEGFRHLKVNHSVNFQDPETGAHTNRIEACWRSAKVTIVPGSRRKAFFPSYLAKYMFMKMCRIQKIDTTVAFYRMAGELNSPVQPSEETSIKHRDMDAEDTFNDFD